MRMSSANFCLISSPIGYLSLHFSEQALTRIDVLASATKPIAPVGHFAQKVVAELQAYFSNAQHCFSLSLAKQGTVFQQKVWQVLCAIPAGEVRTYGELARQLHTSPRAIGQACRRNPIPIVVPCHRVIARRALGGYAGAVDGHLLAGKKWLLTHEGVLK